MTPDPPTDDRFPPVHLPDAARALSEPWSPRVVGRVNDHYLKVARLEGEFVEHAHEDEDELFLVLAGRLVLEMPDRAVELGPGDAFVVPRGVRHRPVASDDCLVALIEPVRTKHTGDEVTSRTRSLEEQMGPAPPPRFDEPSE